jgi:hypothetical protein
MALRCSKKVLHQPNAFDHADPDAWVVSPAWLSRPRMIPFRAAYSQAGFIVSTTTRSLARQLLPLAVCRQRGAGATRRAVPSRPPICGRSPRSPFFFRYLIGEI